jgi:hypothetical protein
MSVSRWLFLGIVAVIIACSGAEQGDGAAIEQDARAFMESYAEDLRSHDKAAIIDRYDHRGAYILGNGQKRFAAFDSIRVGYEAGWQGPAAFEWQDLSFEVISGESILVAGQFFWTLADTLPPLKASYTGLLVRQDGVLRIRLEDESFDLSQAQMLMDYFAALN